MEYTHHKFIKGNIPNYTCVLSNLGLALAMWVFQVLDMLWVPLISETWSSSELVSPSAGSVLCLADVVCSIPCKSYLILGPVMYLTADYTKSVTSSQLCASGGWAVSLIKGNTSLLRGFGKSIIFIFLYTILIFQAHAYSCSPEAVLGFLWLWEEFVVQHNPILEKNRSISKEGF